MGLLRILLPLPCALLWAFSASASAPQMIPILPQPMCGPGWTLEGKIARYDQDTLSDRIDGEAELYFPYGFQFLASGRYTRQDQSLDLDVFRMGSLLDAFGVYANYRPKGAEPVPAVTKGG